LFWAWESGGLIFPVTGAQGRMAKIEKAPTGEFHSGYGCVIMALAAGMFGFILWWGWYSLTTMDREIGAVAQAEAAVLPVITPVPDLEKRLADFAATDKAGGYATLMLSVADLNALLVLAPDGGNGSYKDMLRVKALDAAKGLIVTDGSLPMNTAKFWEGTKRYLVGEIDFKIEQTELGPDAKVAAVRVPGKTVPAEMVKGMQMYGYLGPYQSHPVIGPVLKQIRSADIEDGKLVLTNRGG
jgi:hypothetical protein